MLAKYSPILTGDAKADYEAAQEDGDKIDVVCHALGRAQEIEASTKLKALRYVRKYSRQLHGAPLDDRPFDFPLMQDHHYWAKVDGHFMQYLELQTRNNGGEFFGDPDFGGLEHCRTDYFRVASLPQADVYKSAVVLEGEPIHVFYLAQPPNYEQA
jgi:hypothetical protein